MMKYGGDLANELKKVCVTYKEEEYVSISKSYLNEIMSHRDEYQTMFEEYFQVSGEFYVLWVSTERNVSLLQQH